MTEQQFVEWCDENTWAEWVKGEVIVMSPFSYPHAEFSQFLFRLVAEFAEERDLGITLQEPFQIRLATIPSRRSPDIIFISNRRQKLLRRLELDGAPDLIVEIVSMSSQSRDRRESFSNTKLPACGSIGLSIQSRARWRCTRSHLAANSS